MYAVAFFVHVFRTLSAYLVVIYTTETATISPNRFQNILVQSKTVLSIIETNSYTLKYPLNALIDKMGLETTRFHVLLR